MKIGHSIRRVVTALLLVVSFAATTYADVPSSVELHKRYAALEPKLQNTPFGAPIYIESEDRDGVMRGEVYGVLAQPFSVVSSTLQQLSAWCDLATLHFNIKGCTRRGTTEDGVIALYSGGKDYEDPKNARRLEFRYTLRDARPDYFRTTLSSDDGPLDTSDYRMDVEAVPLGKQTFAHVRFTYRYRSLSRMLSATYFATVGRNKVGFSVVGSDRHGEPIYIKGRNGAMERTVMRNYLGLQALFESLDQPEAQRFEWRLQRWYALTARYRRQLYEVDEEDYLQTKRQEHVGSLELQSEVDRQSE